MVSKRYEARRVVKMTKKNKKMHLKESCQGNEGKSEKKMKKSNIKEN